MDLGLENAAAVVQGGTMGMGRATAECLAQDGARVAVMARTQTTIDETCDRLRTLGSPDVLGLQADMTSFDAVQAAFGQVEDRWGELNILVTAAGPSAAGKFEELTDDDWTQTFDEGCVGMVRCVRAALPLLRRADWARIVIFSAHSVKRQSVDLTSYTAAKAATTSVAKNLSLTLAPEEILVNTISPGSFASPGLKKWVDSLGADSSDLRVIMQLIDEHYDAKAHMPRAGEPAEIGPVAAFLASRRNSYMTGADVNVDGGSDFC